jgi:uncharacterized protein with HEPN domain
MWRDSALLLDMLLAARKVRTFNAAATWGTFQADEMLQSATEYQLQIVGEAASKVSKEFQVAHPEVPWPKIVGLRHRLVHDYPRIELPKIWAIVENQIPPLIAALEPLVPPEQGAK